MREITLFGLIGPSITLIFAMTFLVVWSLNKKHRYVLHGALAFVFASLSLLGSTLSADLMDVTTRVGRYTLFSISNILAVSAISLRYDKPVPINWLIGISLIGLAPLIATAQAQTIVLAEMVFINLPFATMYALAAWLTFRSGRTAFADRLLCAVLGLTALQFALRPLLLPLFFPDLQAAAYEQSVYWSALNASAVILSVLIAIAFMAVCVGDLVGEVEEKSGTDLLSGLKTRRSFEAAAAPVIAAGHRTKLPVSLIIADIDHFKRINDTLGHQTGDRVIAAFGELVLDSARAADVSGRIGGEEFAVLMWNADIKGARLLAEAVRTQFSARDIEDIPNVWDLTCSFGVAELTPGESFDTLFARADEALYAAKRGGRDRVSVTMDSDVTGGTAVA